MDTAGDYRTLIWRSADIRTVPTRQGVVVTWGWGNGDRTATVVVESRSLVREALVSLMESHSQHVMCSVASTTDIERSAFK
jgi:hypothetical protein